MTDGGCERELADTESGEGMSASTGVHDETGVCGAWLGVNLVVGSVVHSVEVYPRRRRGSNAVQLQVRNGLLSSHQSSAMRTKADLRSATKMSRTLVSLPVVETVRKRMKDEILRRIRVIN